jgi:hypothetical protein
VYRLDFAGKKSKDKQAYISMFAEYGWEYLQDVNGYSYFRKNADGISDEDTEIFSDSESHLDMIKKLSVPIFSYKVFVSFDVVRLMLVALNGFFIIGFSPYQVF